MSPGEQRRPARSGLREWRGAFDPSRPIHIRIFIRLFGASFLASATWIALRFDWWWLLPVAALGAWNKESFLFFMPTLYPFLRQRASSRLLATVTVATLTVVCGLVYLHMRTRFAHNPGSTAIMQWKDHFLTLFNPFAFSARLMRFMVSGWCGSLRSSPRFF